MPEYHGSCLCKAVQVSAQVEKPELSTCHCESCRKWCTGPFMAFEAKHVDLEPKEKVTHYASSDIAKRTFCKSCGTSLSFYYNNMKQICVNPWIFENVQGITSNVEVCYDNKPDCYSFANDTKKYTEAETMAMVDTIPEYLPYQN
ncbi:S-(hydroxymethyl)glutathione synthase activity [Schizosaccharomyces cryophilus OY26]|uniref:S-(Hydroxymethyl)glutathione synthase activity n=1 Tax=Schizosaccharomyces cryophilus (strain OY26 / ATCC MYA-4695 / CBS 11777 / NBRC 106824 / NRRL Y48691) TaxID=653667 RepID=S9XK02_SCHCR|nr:S-(hydroxymethyl)glutathione synthase activity [Schizosaccharomyces cryophilus OY26]EPY54031.1 S-(hydroxymethyl)glutathione synthase activity [Schizosaccharomyces cryophilus OY26]